MGSSDDPEACFETKLREGKSLDHTTVATELKPSPLLSNITNTGRARRLLGYWLVCIGSLGVQYAFGAIYVIVLETFESSLAQAALIGAMGAGTMDTLAIFSGMLVLRIGPHKACLLGALLSACGLAASAFVAQWWHLVFTYSILMGMGHSFSLYSCVAVMLEFFDKRLALAHAFANMGAALTPLIFGIAGVEFFEGLGWGNGMLFLAAVDGVVLLVAGILLTPPPRASTGQHTETANEKKFVANEITVKTTAKLADKKIVELYTNSEPTVPAVEAVSVLEVMRGTRFKILCCSCFFFGNGAWINIVHIVRMATTVGMPSRDASGLLIWLASGSLSFRLPIGFVADPLGRRRTLVLLLLAYALVVVLAAVPVLAASFTYLRLHAFVAGGLTGSFLSVVASVPAELLPPGHKTLGTAAIFTPIGFGVMVGPFVAGALVDATGTYTDAKLLSSGCLVASAIFMAWAGFFK
jgi:MFS family permease